MRPQVLSRVLMMALVLGVLPRLAEAQATIKPPSSYNQQEREAVEVVRGWLNAWTDYDMVKLMSYMADDLTFRGDPSESLQPLPRFQRMAQGVMNGWCGMDLEDGMTIAEVFVTGTEWDSAVMIKRSDRAGRRSHAGGEVIAPRLINVGPSAGPPGR